MYPVCTHSAPSSRESGGEITMGPEKQSAKHVEHPLPRTHSIIHPPTHRPNYPPTHQPAHPRRVTAIQKSTAADALIQTEFSCCDTGISMFLRFSANPGIEQTHPREGACPRSPLAEFGPAPVIRRGQRRAAVWVRRSATARPREAEWSSRFAAVLWVLQEKYFQRSK